MCTNVIEKLVLFWLHFACHLAVVSVWLALIAGIHQHPHTVLDTLQLRPSLPELLLMLLRFYIAAPIMTDPVVSTIFDASIVGYCIIPMRLFYVRF